MMTEELQHMIYLKIEDNKGFFLKEVENGSTAWSQIDQITKDDLFYLLNKAIAEDFEMNEFSEDTLSNKVHLIIYKSLYEKFSDLILNKTRFKDESESLYKQALEKYKVAE